MAYPAPRVSSESLILDLVRARQSLTLEQLITLLPELTWNQVFRTVDELSRRGAIVLLRKGFQYELAWVGVKKPTLSCVS
jgi:hypothetical protein